MAEHYALNRLSVHGRPASVVKFLKNQSHYKDFLIYEIVFQPNDCPKVTSGEKIQMTTLNV